MSVFFEKGPLLDMVDGCVAETFEVVGVGVPRTPPANKGKDKRSGQTTKPYY